MKWLVADTLTGKVVGQLEPTKWEVTDPLRAPGTGSLTLPLPSDRDALARLVDLTRPRSRWAAMQGDDGKVLWAGPIPRRAARDGGNVTIPLVDWRGWFYKTYIRPLVTATATARRNYIRTGSNALEQGLIMRDLLRLGLGQSRPAGELAPPGAPRMVIDTTPTTGITREITAMMLDRPIGEHLDSITERDRGCEWWTYATFDGGGEDETRLLPHVAVAWPERRTRTTPVVLEYRTERGGNVADYSWPEGQDAHTRVWALGDGEPPAQVYVSDQYRELGQGVEVLWETTLGPLSGVTRSATAFEYAYEAIRRSRGKDGTASFTVAGDQRPLLTEFSTGDRARVVLDDIWDTANIPAARIVSRTLSGGKGLATAQSITVDLADTRYPDDGTPGEVVGE